MKLKNKKTAEIVEVESLYLTQNQELQLTFTDEKNERKLYMTDKISVFENEWEDYEEPKEYWYIDYDGGILCGESDNSSAEKMMLSMGNHFETIEDAEKAVEKLKAWKRLKDKGFRFCGWATNEGIRGVDFEVPDSFFSEHNHSCISDETRADLDLLFGGEE